MRKWENRLTIQTTSQRSRGGVDDNEREGRDNGKKVWKEKRNGNGNLEGRGNGKGRTKVEEEEETLPRKL